MKKIEISTTPINLVADNFERWRQRNKIELVELDLDDTVCVTHPVFTRHIQKASEILATKLNYRDKNEWLKEITNHSDAVFETHKVNPSRWKKVAELALPHDAAKYRSDLEKLFAQIYYEPLVYKDGAKEFIEQMDRINCPLRFHTHANFDWTMRKCEWLDIDKGRVDITNEDEHKTANSWKSVLKKNNCQPENALTGGDSPRTDINPSLEIGVKHIVLLQDPQLWTIHQQAVGERVWGITSIRDILFLGEEENREIIKQDFER